MTWSLMWRNVSAATLNATLQLLVIYRLGPLKNLKGEIRIRNLENVKDEEEAKSAKLNEKEIFNLQLYWHWNRAEEFRYDKDEKVLEGLQPHPNLKTLLISHYGGKKFPSWVGSSLYHNLIEINLSCCWGCEKVPTLGQLPCLRVLEITGMGKVRCIGSEFYFNNDGSYRNTTTLFRALRILKLEEMETLEEWKDAKELTSASEVFPCLETLILSECRKLRYLPGVLSFIRHLEITWCGIDELLSGLQFCKSLQHFKIEFCPNLKSIPESLHACSSLQNFIVINCLMLRSLPGVPSDIRQLEIIKCGIDELPSGLQSCKSLQYLNIEGCPYLKSIPDLGEPFHSLTNLILRNYPYPRQLKLSRREGRLKTLVISGFIEELDAFPILRYPFIRYSHASLKRLRLHGSPTLNSLSNEIQLFTALEELQIQNFNGMEALPDWFSYLSSLQKLYLYYCKKLMHLPILHLTNLKHLHIDRCRNLGKRCARGSGAEWFQIAHVPNIRIDGEYIHWGEDSDDFEDSEDYNDFEDEESDDSDRFYNFDDSEYEESDDFEDDRDD